MIALVMQHLDNSITTFTERSKLGFRRMTSKQGHGEPNPTWIPVGNEVTRRIAKKIDGVAGGTWGELFNIPLTAHFLGGAAIGDTPEHGVIDPYQRVYGYPTLSVMDGAAISANLGVNPSLSITAQAERAASLWPNKDEVDQRPAQGQSTSGSRRYRRSIRSCPPMRLRRCDGCRSSRSVRPADRLGSTSDIPLLSVVGFNVGPMQMRYRYRIEPTRAQQRMLAQVFGCCRVVFNDALRLRDEAFRAGLSCRTARFSAVSSPRPKDDRAALALSGAQRGVGAIGE